MPALPRILGDHSTDPASCAVVATCDMAGAVSAIDLRLPKGGLSLASVEDLRARRVAEHLNSDDVPMGANPRQRLRMSRTSATIPVRPPGDAFRRTYKEVESLAALASSVYNAVAESKEMVAGAEIAEAMSPPPQLQARSKGGRRVSVAKRSMSLSTGALPRLRAPLGRVGSLRHEVQSKIARLRADDEAKQAFYAEVDAFVARKRRPTSPADRLRANLNVANFSLDMRLRLIHSRASLRDARAVTAASRREMREAEARARALELLNRSDLLVGKRIAQEAARRAQGVIMAWSKVQHLVQCQKVRPGRRRGQRLCGAHLEPDPLGSSWPRAWTEAVWRVCKRTRPPAFRGTGTCTCCGTE